MLACIGHGGYPFFGPAADLVTVLLQTRQHLLSSAQERRRGAAAGAENGLPGLVSVAANGNG